MIGLAFLSRALPVLALFLCLGAFAGTNNPPARDPDHGKNDVYRDFAQLARQETAGTDYRIVTNADSARPKSAVSVLAIHGGGIEFGTSELARLIAAEDYNLYLFEGLKPRGSGQNKRLHITSRRFDEPRALELLSHSDYAVSVHGFLHRESPMVLIGGANEQLKTAVAEQLAKLNLEPGAFAISVPDKQNTFPATESDNIVNRARLGGVQLELSTDLRERLAGNEAARNKFAGAVRAAVRDVTEATAAANPCAAAFGDLQRKK